MSEAQSLAPPLALESLRAPTPSVPAPRRSLSEVFLGTRRVPGSPLPRHTVGDPRQNPRTGRRCTGFPPLWRHSVSGENPPRNRLGGERVDSLLPIQSPPRPRAAFLLQWSAQIPQVPDTCDPQRRATIPAPLASASRPASPPPRQWLPPPPSPL